MGLQGFCFGIRCLGKAWLLDFQDRLFRTHIPPQHTRFVALLYDGDLSPPLPMEALVREWLASGRVKIRQRRAREPAP
jgi:hypothetical protein